MKLFIATILTLNVFANLCDGSLGQVWENDESNSGNFRILNEYDHPISKKLWKKLPNIQELDYNQCKNHVSIMYIRDKGTKKNYTLYFTNEDICDGGNSYGAITYKGKVVGEIGDGDFYCK